MGLKKSENPNSYMPTYLVENMQKSGDTAIVNQDLCRLLYAMFGHDRFLKASTALKDKSAFELTERAAGFIDNVEKGYKGGGKCLDCDKQTKKVKRLGRLVWHYHDRCDLHTIEAKKRFNLERQRRFQQRLGKEEYTLYQSTYKKPKEFYSMYQLVRYYYRMIMLEKPQRDYRNPGGWRTKRRREK